MAISTLSTISTKYFAGGAYLFKSSSSGLAALLNTVITKVNEVINGMTDLDTLTVGSAATYYLGGHSWMVIDGVNPPLFSKIRLQDQDSGAWYELRVNSGVLAVHSV